VGAALLSNGLDERPAGLDAPEATMNETIAPRRRQLAAAGLGLLGAAAGLAPPALAAASHTPDLSLPSLAQART
jgi:hypothetical protein